MPSFDINAILSAALATAISEAVAPLVERIATLETRLAALENNPAIGVDTTLERRVAALESRSDASGLSKSAVEALIEQTMDHHLECYDHDNYDEIASKVDDMPDADDFVMKDDLSDAVRDAVQDLSFEVRVR